ncbi:hypothetical protein IM043_gp128 [Bacillus phage SPG24]|uniref:hypothetical protein n=1 Tax=Bacillus phage SPG24 TaxID=1497851 RepID=UPI0022BA516D|nr:hypothetical protein IM043_gp128 [Bacillus phage SPG24]
MRSFSYFKKKKNIKKGIDQSSISLYTRVKKAREGLTVTLNEKREQKRTKKYNKRIKLCFLIILCVICYYVGFGHGQASAYLKKHDDVNLAPRSK